MTINNENKGMTDEEIKIRGRIAEFMGWTKGGFSGEWWWATQKHVAVIPVADWNPLRSWDDWRMVENKMLSSKNEDLLPSFFNTLHVASIISYLKSDLPARCRALISILDSTKQKDE